MELKPTATLKQIAALLEIPPEWLDAVITFESNWKPQQRAFMPYNQARIIKYRELPKYAKGLIQFTDETAQNLGFKDSADLIAKYPTAESQLKTPVYNYLKQFRPFPTKQSFYMAIFYPVARSWPETKEMPDSVKVANPNINTVADYVNFVERKLKKKTIISAGAMITLAIIAFITYKLLNRGAKNGREKEQE